MDKVRLCQVKSAGVLWTRCFGHGEVAERDGVVEHRVHVGRSLRGEGISVEARQSILI